FARSMICATPLARPTVRVLPSGLNATHRAPAAGRDGVALGCFGDAHHSPLPTSPTRTRPSTHPAATQRPSRLKAKDGLSQPHERTCAWLSVFQTRTVRSLAADARYRPSPPNARRLTRSLWPSHL